MHKKPHAVPFGKNTARGLYVTSYLTFGSAYGIEFIVVKSFGVTQFLSCQRKEDTIDYLGGNISYGIGDVAGNYSGFAEGRLKTET